jgi:hypothetical protein
LVFFFKEKLVASQEKEVTSKDPFYGVLWVMFFFSFLFFSFFLFGFYNVVVLDF